ncbi:hypothetical protein EK21DRAFT_97410 [Setomelanomma holmii]|uniref:Uncharacterized protein n=1 Tax=Setomelanomma holmii TaxID=210430 RepID=A0A9P4HHZ0_9PLEO|nr:hypothetical protein EK21DRAFT_97410 [Setomelanomma holmii]
MSLEAPPPSRHVSSTTICLSDASRMLETYLTNSESHPHLHPDALITPTGVTFSSHGGPMGSVLMHNLRRVAAGLRGEYLEPEKTPEPEDNGEEEFAGGRKFKKKGGNKRKETSVEDWQDKAQYEQEEGGFEIGELGPRTNFVEEGGEEPQVEITGGPQEERSKKMKKDEAGAGGEERKMSKEARKLAKKEKNMQRKREQAQKTAGGA